MPHSPLKGLCEDSIYSPADTPCRDVHGHLWELKTAVGNTMNVTMKGLQAASVYSPLWLPGFTDLGLSVAQKGYSCFFVLILFGFFESFRDMIWLTQILTFSI